jgi:hypothetical protein
MGPKERAKKWNPNRGEKKREMNAWVPSRQKPLTRETPGDEISRKEPCRQKVFAVSFGVEGK